MTIRIFEVGGAVRDSFRGVKSKDLDYAVEAPSYADMREKVIELGAQIYIEHPEFVTIRANWNKIPCDFTLCRKEGEYLDNRHPSSCEPGTIIEDLARRDFTMNAIAVDTITQEVIDPFGGIEDIKHGLIKCVGDPFKRFAEDALRIMRAIRFSICMEFDIHSTTHLALFASLELLDNISAERIKDELHKMFRHNSMTALKELSKFNRYQLSKMFNERTGIWLEPTMKEK